MPASPECIVYLSLACINEFFFCENRSRGIATRSFDGLLNATEGRPDGDPRRIVEGGIPG